MAEKAFIWDMDGTLIDSYGAIVSTLKETYAAFGIELDPGEIRRHVMKYSVGSYINIVEKRTGKQFSEMQDVYLQIEEVKNKEITLIKNVHEILDYLKDQGCRNFVYTHRGPSTGEILKRCGADGYFTELVTKENGFPRKPEPDALNYLTEKYGLDKDNTFYVGDRSIDMECAANAGIGGILYRPEGSYTDPVGTEKYIIKDINEIRGIL